ncbi:inverse autotransporter beta domain-containing protein [[Leptolyngbya] sp. PCC 7376]|uniref:inverse autotransporter beta domain-containing protein n=1 Tax=[Leptolyngbya] sp. PCC 7376 TaxID=111781 RepID=UPI0002EF2E3F|nr:inverse autotransporter beta domain-containing protein [[Leptolyngbya] sp. PCC 7376]
MGSVSTAIAQTTPSEIAQTETTTELFVKPQYGVNFTTGPGSGYESSYGSFYGWFPFAQDGTSQLLFTEARGNIDTDNGNWGGNVALGYRNFSGKTILGGYIGYDVRGLEDWTTHQIGLGVEALNPGWEARVNGYIPVGDRRETIRNSTLSSSTTSNTTTNTVVSDPTFSSNNLVVTADTLTTITTTTRTIRELISEESLGGLDIETGAKLTTWQNGFLKGFLGSYLYSGDRTETFLGIRGRLEAKFSNLNLGLGLESDGEFGTNLIFSIGANFGGQPSKASDSKTDNLVLPLQRQRNIALNQFREFTEQTETSTVTNTTTSDPVVLNNPVTGQPWFFSHVNLESMSDGSGTEEDPNNLIATALGIVPQDGNGIVYVEGTGTSSPGFTVPANVKVVSSAPLLPQVLNSVPALPSVDVTSSVLTGNVTLPRAGTGDRPEITSDVGFSNGGGELNGFEFNNGSRITFADIGGTVTVANNVINNSTGDAIEANISNGSTTTINVLNNQIDNPQLTGGMTVPSADGIDIEVSGNSNVTLLAEGNTITNSQNSGIELETNPNSDAPNSSLNSTITNNQITNSGGDGILFLHNSNVAMTMTVDNNAIDQAGLLGNGITRTPGPPAVDIGAGGFGVGVITLGDGNLALAITNNQISNTQDAKIGIAVNPAFVYLDSAASTVLGGSGSGNITPDNPLVTVFLQTEFAGSSRIDADISGNNLTGSGAGIDDLSSLVGMNGVGYNLSNYNNGSFTAIAGNNGTVCLNLENNMADSIGGSGFQFVRNNSSQITNFSPMSGSFFFGPSNPQLIIGTNTGNTGSVNTPDLPTTSGVCN